MVNSIPLFTQNREKVDLVITSPPYPGIHVLYNRWHVDGRRETPAPYWIASCLDGHGLSYYTFGNRHENGLNTYFSTAAEAFSSIREVLRPGGLLVQLIAFCDRRNHLRRYLEVLSKTGFSEVRQRNGSGRRIWRTVPHRKWYTSINKGTSSSREVILIHRAL